MVSNYESNGSAWVAFVATFLAMCMLGVMVGCVGRITIMLGVVGWVMAENSPLGLCLVVGASVGAALGVLAGLWQATIAGLPKGNAANARLWWQYLGW
jgi:hypothetical protein